jgi:hypothetical protein
VIASITGNAEKGDTRRRRDSIEMSLYPPSRHFAALQQTVAFGCIATSKAYLGAGLAWMQAFTHIAAFRANDCIDDGTDRCPARYFSSLWYMAGQGSCTAVVLMSFHRVGCIL